MTRSEAEAEVLLKNCLRLMGVGDKLGVLYEAAIEKIVEKYDADGGQESIEDSYLDSELNLLFAGEIDNETGIMLTPDNVLWIKKFSAHGYLVFYVEKPVASPVLATLNMRVPENPNVSGDFFDITFSIIRNFDEVLDVRVTRIDGNKDELQSSILLYSLC